MGAVRIRAQEPTAYITTPWGTALVLIGGRWQHAASENCQCCGNPGAQEIREIPVPAESGRVRTCASCGSDEKIRRRYQAYGSTWVRLDCTHLQNDDEY